MDMMKVLKSLKSLILYDGLKNKEEYESIVPDIKEQNRKNISFYSLLMSIAFICLYACSYFVEDLEANKYSYLCSFLLACFIFAGMYYLARKNLIINTIFTYLFSTMMLVFATVIGTINEPSEPAVSFCVLLVILPFITYDMAIRSVIHRLIMSIIFIVMVFVFKDKSVVWTDVVDVCCYGFIGCVVGALNQKIKTNSYFLSRNMDREIKLKTAQLENLTMEAIGAMSDTLEAKDEYTRGHSNRVSEYSVLIAKKMNLSDDKISEIRYAASLHDIGKIGVPDSILNKPDKLTDEEYDIIRNHCTIGSDILSNINLISYASNIARHHHERYDGKGYPDGLKGDGIPLGARIVAVADSFDAMNSKRVYREPLDRNIIISELKNNKGIQFDPDVVDALLEILNSAGIEEISAK